MVHLSPLSSLFVLPILLPMPLDRAALEAVGAPIEDAVTSFGREKSKSFIEPNRKVPRIISDYKNNIGTDYWCRYNDHHIFQSQSKLSIWVEPIFGLGVFWWNQRRVARWWLRSTVVGYFTYGHSEYWIT
jgi:hypothetical protein